MQSLCHYFSLHTPEKKMLPIFYYSSSIASFWPPSRAPLTWWEEEAPFQIDSSSIKRRSANCTQHDDFSWQVGTRKVQIRESTDISLKKIRRFLRRRCPDLDGRLYISQTMHLSSLILSSSRLDGWDEGKGGDVAKKMHFLHGKLEIAFAECNWLVVGQCNEVN